VNRGRRRRHEAAARAVSGLRTGDVRLAAQALKWARCGPPGVHTTLHVRSLALSVHSRTAILSRYEEARGTPSPVDGLQTRRGLQEAEATRREQACGFGEQAATTTAKESSNARGNGQVRAQGDRRRDEGADDLRRPSGYECHVLDVGGREEELDGRR
jgi:hypothetical protein